MKSDMEWAEMVELHQQGISIGEIANKMGVDRKTARKYIQTTSPPRYVRAGRGSKLDPFKDYIRSELEKNPYSAPKMMRKIREKGYTGGISILKDFMLPIKDASRVVAEIRFETEPGEQSQVDWIDFGMREVDGARVHLFAFVMVLGWSRMRFVRFTTDVRTETFIHCHLLAFQYFRGYTRTILYDNLKNVVIKRAILSSESKFNEMYLDFSRHHGILPRLCKPGIEGAKTKGKVENAVQYVQRDYFMGLEYETIAELNDGALDWCDRVNSEVHSTIHEVPRERWPNEGLTPFEAIVPYQVTIIDHRVASRDCFVQWNSNFYSIPWRYATRECRVLVRNGQLRLEVAGEVVACHDVLEGKKRSSRQKEHFEGLYKLKRQTNQVRHEKRIASQVRTMTPPPSVEVERRDLSYYEMVVRGAS